MYLRRSPVVLVGCTPDRHQPLCMNKGHRHESLGGIPRWMHWVRFPRPMHDFRFERPKGGQAQGPAPTSSVMVTWDSTSKRNPGRPRPGA